MEANKSYLLIPGCRLSISLSCIVFLDSFVLSVFFPLAFILLYLLLLYIQLLPPIMILFFVDKGSQRLPGLRFLVTVMEAQLSSFVLEIDRSLIKSRYICMHS